MSGDTVENILVTQGLDAETASNIDKTISEKGVTPAALAIINAGSDQEGKTNADHIGAFLSDPAVKQQEPEARQALKSLLEGSIEGIKLSGPLGGAFDKMVTAMDFDNIKAARELVASVAGIPAAAQEGANKAMALAGQVEGITDSTINSKVRGSITR